MSYSPAFHIFLTQATSASSDAELRAVLIQARAELPAEEYEALVQVLRDVGLIY